MKTVNVIPLIDTLQLSGPLTAYSIARSNAALTLFDKRAAVGVPISLVGVERLKFSDKDIAIDLDGHAGTVVKIIGAVIGSDFVKNPIYVGIGLGYLDKGMSYSDLCLLALKAMGATTADAIVSLLWRNVVGFNATDEQKAPYIKMLADGMKPGDLAIFAADTDLNVRNIGLAVLKESGVEYTPANVDYTPPDTVPPSITISSNLSTLSIGEKAIITFTLSENSSNFTVGDVSVVGGVLSNFEGKDKNYTVTFTLLDNSTTGAIIYVSGSKFSDAAGNPNIASTHLNISVTSDTGDDGVPEPVPVDTSAPTLNSSTPADNATAVVVGGNIVLSFSETVTAGSGNIVITNSAGDTRTIAVGDAQVNISGSTVTINPTADLLANSAYNIQMASGVIKDATGNAYAGIANATTLNFSTPDTLAPTVAIVVADAALSVGETSLVTFTFSEVVTGFTNEDLSAIENGTLTAVATTDGGITYTATFTPAASITDTTNVITLLKTGVADTAGNAGVSSTSSNNYAIDTLAPTLAIVVADAALSVGETSLVTFTFSEVVTGFTNADLSAIENGTLTDVVSTDGGITYTATFTPTASITDTTSVITLLKTGVADAPGNAGVGSTNSNNYAIDTLAPTLSSSTPSDNATAVVVGDNIVLSFSETVLAGTGNFVITNGAADTRTIPVGDAQVSISGSTVTINPTADLLANSAYNIQMASGVLRDSAGNAFAGIADASTLNFSTPNINLSDIAAGAGGFVINGQGADDRSGFRVASAGDVNGDGLADLIVGANSSDPVSGTNAGRSYVVFGQTAGTAINLSAIAPDTGTGTGGFVINGQCAGDLSGISVASAGDVNGDGLADLIVGALYSDPAGRTNAGRSYVVFGQTSGTPINLSAIAAGTGGFVINGQCADDTSGRSVASAGDVNGDGLTDLIVGAPDTNAEFSYTGSSYVVFGQTAGTAINLSAIAAGTGGFVINGQCNREKSGFSVASAGDVNGDGLADLIVGVNGTSAGRSYVVFGQTAGTAINLSAIAAGTGGFVINGQCAGDSSGRSVASAGDVNGDGLADLIVGASASDPASGTDAGRSYVVFGQTAGTAINLSAIAPDTGTGTGGFVINGQCADDQSGFSVASAGDVNGDGLADLIVGARTSDPASGTNAGRSYVVFGQTAGTAINLSAIAAGTGGFVINGQGASDYSGVSVASAGDVNGDGLADLIVGANLSDPASGTDAGRSYVIFGSTTGAFSQTAVDQLGTSADNTLVSGANADVIVAGAGNDTITAGGGADVLYGGAGNDVFILNTSNIAALALGVTDGQLARIDGGGGLDTIRLDGGGIAFNLTSIANQGASSPSSASRIESIERIDLTGSGNNTLTLTDKDVMDMARMNLINSSTQAALGWTNGTYTLPANEAQHQLIVDGDAGDTVTLTDGTWSIKGTVTQSGTAYTVYNRDNGLAQVLVASAITRNHTADTTAPTLSSSTPADNVTGVVVGSNIVLNFSETVIAGTGNFVITNGAGDTRTIAVGDAQVTISGSTVTINPTADLLINSAYNIQMASGVLRDSAGNAYAGIADASTLNFSTTDTLAPTVAIVVADAALSVGETSLVTFTFSEVVTGFTNEDLSAIENGTLTAVATTDGGITYTATFTPAASITDTTNVITLLKTGVADTAGNAGVSSTSSNNYAIDTLAPTLAIVVADAALSVGETSLVTFTFSEVVTGFTNEDLSAIENGTLTAVATTDGGITYTATFTPAASITDTTNVITLLKTGVADTAGNAGVGSTNSNNYAIDTLAPTLSSSTPSDNATAVVVGDNIVLSFSETVLAGTGNFVITNGAGDTRTIPVGDAQVSISGSTVTINPTADLLANSAYNIQMASGVLRDSAGNAYAGIANASTLNFFTPLFINLTDIAAGEGGFVINGQCADDRSGRSVASAGDVNGDGLADLIVGARLSDPASVSNAGRSYVVFGQTAGTAINLSAIAPDTGTGGFVINGQCANDQSGGSVASAGDVNGDGLADLIVGAYFGDPAGRNNAGRSYVVFGQTAGTAINLSAIAAGTGGFVINGQCANDQSGGSVASAGDVNGDGLADLIVAADRGVPASGFLAGRSYVVFGQTAGTAINLSAIAAGTGGFVINGQCADDRSGISVASAGDVNGDGLADLIVGAYTSAPAGLGYAGRSYVVFGQTSGTGINLSAIAAGTGGFVINGQCASDQSGRSVASAGDVNGDGLADLIVGAHRGDPASGSNAGRSYVVFGQTSGTGINLSAIAAGTGGFVINGQCGSDYSGRSVASAGDVNGDGLADLIVGAYFGDPASGSNAGRSYVVFGQTAGTAINLSAIAAGTGGFVINGQCASDFSGISVASAGDVNGDGLADLIVGGDFSDPAIGNDAGRSYVIFGSTTGAFSQTAVDQLGTSADNTLVSGANADVIVAGAGNDTITAGGGADVLYGGAGNDVFILNTSNIAALALGVTDGQLARIDGGGGLDTIRLDGGGIAFNLTSIANQGASSPSSASRIESIERIDLTGSGNNTLTLTDKDVMDMARMNLINSSTQAALGWTNGTYTLLANEARHQLIVDGNAGDAVTLTGTFSWTDVGTVTQGGVTYTVYNISTFAQLLLGSGITHN